MVVAMTSLLSAGLAFIGLHLLVAGTRVRAMLVRALGERGYQAVFSLASLAAIIWLARSYSIAFREDNTYYWHLGDRAQHLAAPVMLVALFFVVAGASSPNPMSVGQGHRLKQRPTPFGVQRITRHPVLWGIAIWSAFHIFANGDAASLVLFGSFFLTAVLGTFSIDHKRRAALGEDYAHYAQQTSNLPFLALLQRRTRLTWREFGMRRVLGVLVVFAVLVSVHPFLFHAYPLPGMAD